MNATTKKGFRDPMEFIKAAESSPAASGDPVDAEVQVEGREAAGRPGFPNSRVNRRLAP